MSDFNTNKKRDRKFLLLSTIVFLGMSFLSYYLVVSIQRAIEQGVENIQYLPLMLIACVFSSLIFSIFIYLIATSYFDAKKMALEMTGTLRANEKKYRQIFESFQDIYFETNADGVIVTITPSVEKLLGIPVTKMLGRKFDSLIAIPAQRSNLTQALSAGSIADFELELIKGDQLRPTFSLDAQIIKDINGNKKIHGVLHDVSERKMQRHKEWEKNEELRKLNKILLDREITMSELKENNRRLTEGSNG